MTMDKINGIVDRYEELKATKTALAAATKQNNEQVAAAENELLSALLDMADQAKLDDVSKVSVEVGGKRYSAKIRHFYSIRADQKSEAIEMLRELGYNDLVQERVDDRSLTSMLENATENNDGELPEEFLALPLTDYDKPTVYARKVAH